MFMPILTSVSHSSHHSLVVNRCRNFLLHPGHWTFSKQAQNSLPAIANLTRPHGPPTENIGRPALSYTLLPMTVPQEGHGMFSKARCLSTESRHPNSFMSLSKVILMASGSFSEGRRTCTGTSKTLTNKGKGFQLPEASI